MSDVADKIGVSKQSLSNTLGKGDMRVSTLEKIAFALGVSVAYFYKDQSNPDPLEKIVEKKIDEALAKRQGFGA